MKTFSAIKLMFPTRHVKLVDDDEVPENQALSYDGVTFRIKRSRVLETNASVTWVGVANEAEMQYITSLNEGVSDATMQSVERPVKQRKN